MLRVERTTPPRSYPGDWGIVSQLSAWNGQDRFQSLRTVFSLCPRHQTPTYSFRCGILTLPFPATRRDSLRGTTYAREILMLVRRTVLSRHGDVMNESSVRVGSRTEAVVLIFKEQRSFAVSGYDDAESYYWAKSDEQETHLHQWRIVD